MLIVVGGHTRNIGKTSVVCGIIRALPDLEWTAVKITQYGHGVCSHEGEPCECADPKHPIAVSEESGSRPATDSGRFLAAGARRSFWVRTPAGKLAEAMPRIRRMIGETENTIVESNSVLQFLKPDLCLMVVNGEIEDFKPTSQRFLDRADGLVLTSGANLRWDCISPHLVADKARFNAFSPYFENSALIAKIRDLAS